MSTPSSPIDVRFDLTIFGADGSSPIWGSASDYVVSEASFSTPGDYSAPRQYLRVPENFLASETDFLKGSSDIGGVSVDIVDVRQTATDQTTGIVTSKINEIAGSEAVLRRWFDSLNQWRTIFRGRIASWSVDEDELVVYRLNLEDPRSYEEGGQLFETNETFCLYPTPGPVSNYGLFPSGEDYLLPAAGVASVQFSTLTQTPGSGFVPPGLGRSVKGAFAGVFFLTRANDLDGSDVYENPPYEQFQARLEALEAEADTDPKRVDIPDSASAEAKEIFGDRGYRAIRGITIRWRRSAGEDWIYLRDMPVLYGQENAVLDIKRERAIIYAASFTDSEIPEIGETVQMQILARYTSDSTPYFWDNGTLGDLLYDISQGELTDDAPKETYDTTALAAFRDNSAAARFIETGPRERRRWVQQNIYQPALRGPCLTSAYTLRPVSWVAPDDLASKPKLAQESMLPVGDYRAQFQNAYNSIRVKTITETIRTQEWTERQKEGRLISFGSDTADINLQLTPWERYNSVESEEEYTDAEAVGRYGAQPVTFAPVTIRSIGPARFGSGGRRVVGGDTQDPTAGLVADRFVEEAQARYLPSGAPQYQVPCVMSDPVVRDVEVGDFLRVEAPWLPDRSTGKRNHVRYMQVYGIKDETPDVRILLLEDIGIVAPSDDNTFDPANPDTDCIDQGSTEFSGTSAAADGKKLLEFRDPGEYSFTNNCSGPLTIEVLLIGGGGGGGGGNTNIESFASVGGGGGAGGVVGAYGADDIVDGTTDPLTIDVQPGEVIPVTVGAGGAAGSASPSAGGNGGDTIIWVDANGFALDPLSDTPVYKACGGGGGGPGAQNVTGSDGGSGGGGGARSPNSIGGFFSPGGADCDGDQTQGNDGGTGSGNLGFVTCSPAYAGGGGSFASAGGAGSSTFRTVGVGANGAVLANWGITTGAGGGGAYAVANSVIQESCARLISSGAANAGSGGTYGAGGSGGASADVAATPGTSGIALIRYKGSAPSLTAPNASAETPSEQEDTVCVTVADADWPAVEPPDYRVRVDYAVAASEPAADSGLWITVGYLTEPGTICTPPLPTGATVHTRTVALSSVTAPSTPGTTIVLTTAETPDLLSFSLERSGSSVTASFTPNDFCLGVELDGYLADENDEYDDTLLEDLDFVAASTGTYSVPLSVARGKQLFVRARAWSTESGPIGTQGNDQVRSITNATPRVPTLTEFNAVLTTLVFDDELNLVLDDDLNVVTDE